MLKKFGQLIIVCAISTGITYSVVKNEADKKLNSVKSIMIKNMSILSEENYVLMKENEDLREERDDYSQRLDRAIRQIGRITDKGASYMLAEKMVEDTRKKAYEVIKMREDKKSLTK